MTKLPEMTWRQLPTSPKAHGEMVDRLKEVISMEMADEGFTRYENAARAVLEAMREPTGAMIDAAGDVHVLGADLHDFVAHQCAAPVWRAMIDEALK